MPILIGLQMAGTFTDLHTGQEPSLEELKTIAGSECVFGIQNREDGPVFYVIGELQQAKIDQVVETGIIELEKPLSEREVVQSLADLLRHIRDRDTTAESPPK